MGRHAQRDGVETGTGEGGDFGVFPQRCDKGQGAGPERLHQRFEVLGYVTKFLSFRKIRNM